MIRLWIAVHRHIIHVINNVNPGKLDNEWISGSEYGNISLRSMIIDFLMHFNLHLDEIRDLMDQQ